MKDLNGKKVAILATNGFEQSELDSPKQALENANATVHVISLEEGSIRGWSGENWSDSTVAVDKKLSDVSASDYNALVLPGGVINPDLLRTKEDVISFVRDFFKQHKPVAAICHGPWTLINAEVVEGRKMTSYHTIRKDLENAGANWVDQSVVVDQGLVTSRKPDDLPDFNKKLIEEVAEGKHAGQTV